MQVTAKRKIISVIGKTVIQYKWKAVNAFMRYVFAIALVLMFLGSFPSKTGNI